MIILIILFIIATICAFTYVIIDNLDKKTKVETKQVAKKTYDWNMNAKIEMVEEKEVVKKYNIKNADIIKKVLGVGTFIAGAFLFCFSCYGLSCNLFVEQKQKEAETYRTVLATKYKYYQNYGTEYIKSETAVREYSKLVKQIGDFNNTVYFVNAYKDNAWIGLFVERGYIGLETITL